MAGLDFKCTVRPTREGRWEVLIEEVHGWRSLDVDVALSQWPRKKVGGTWGDSSVVGTYRVRKVAELAARNALRLAVETNQQAIREQEAHARHMSQDPIVFRSDGAS